MIDVACVPSLPLQHFIRSLWSSSIFAQVHQSSSCVSQQTQPRLTGHVLGLHCTQMLSRMKAPGILHTWPKSASEPMSFEGKGKWTCSPIWKQTKWFFPSPMTHRAPGTLVGSQLCAHTYRTTVVRHGFSTRPAFFSSRTCKDTAQVNNYCIKMQALYSLHS